MKEREEVGGVIGRDGIALIGKRDEYGIVSRVSCHARRCPGDPGTPSYHPLAHIKVERWYRDALEIKTIYIILLRESIDSVNERGTVLG